MDKDLEWMEAVADIIAEVTGTSRTGNYTIEMRRAFKKVRRLKKDRECDIEQVCYVSLDEYKRACDLAEYWKGRALCRR